MPADEDVVRLWNRSWLVSLSVTLALGLAVGAAVAADPQLTVAAKVVAILWLPTVLSGALVWIPMLQKVLHLQPWLRISEKGLDYGGRVLVPWTAVVAIQPHKTAKLSRRRAAFVLHGWEPPGRVARLAYVGAVPLADFSRRWRSRGVIEALGRWAPHVVLADEYRAIVDA